MSPNMTNLRPIERRIVALQRTGDSVGAIARKLNRSTNHVERMISWIDIPRSRPPTRKRPSALQSRVITLRDRGESYEDIADRFCRRPNGIRQIEGMARVVQARDQLTFELGLALLTAAAGEARRNAVARQPATARAEHPRTTGDQA